MISSRKKIKLALDPVLRMKIPEKKTFLRKMKNGVSEIVVTLQDGKIQKYYKTITELARITNRPLLIYRPTVLSANNYRSRSRT